MLSTKKHKVLGIFSIFYYSHFSPQACFLTVCFYFCLQYHMYEFSDVNGVGNCDPKTRVTGTRVFDAESSFSFDLGFFWFFDLIIFNTYIFTLPIFLDHCTHTLQLSTTFIRYLTYLIFINTSLERFPCQDVYVQPKT